MMGDDHRMQPDHAPTPFTAAEIRAAHPSGRWVDTETTTDGAVTSRRRTTFAGADDDGVTMVVSDLDADDGDGSSRRVAWRDLQAHASFPASVTSISDEQIETPLGTLMCRRYDVVGDDHTNTFWFSPDHPGMPVRLTSSAAHGPTTTVLAFGP